VECDYYDGVGQGWNLTVDQTGAATYCALGQGRNPVQHIRISDAQIAELNAAIDNQRFFDLHIDSGDLIFSGDETKLTILRGDRQKSIVFPGLGAKLEDQPDMHKGLVVLEIVRSWVNDNTALQPQN